MGTGISAEKMSKIVRAMGSEVLENFLVRVGLGELVPVFYDGEVWTRRMRVSHTQFYFDRSTIWIHTFGASKVWDPIKKKAKPDKIFGEDLWVLSGFGEMPLIDEIRAELGKNRGYVRDYENRFLSNHDIKDTLWTCVYGD